MNYDVLATVCINYYRVHGKLTALIDIIILVACGNFSDISSLKLLRTKGSIGHAFTFVFIQKIKIRVGFYPFVTREICVLTEPALRHLH